MIESEELLRLIHQSTQGNASAFSQLVRAYQGYVYALLYKQVRNKETAEDLAQETFLKAYKNLTKLRDPRKFKSWLTRISLNVAHSWFKSRSYRDYSSMPFDEKFLENQEDKSGTRFSPEKIEVLTSILSQIQRMKPKYREVVVLCLLESYTYREAGEVLGIPTGTVASRMNTALSQLRKKARDDR